MKRPLFLSILVLSSITSRAQAPDAFNYQAVARNAGGDPLTNQVVSFRISVLSGSSVGPTVFSETHVATTNDLGIANLQIGQGALVSGSFNSISWGTSQHFIKVELDPLGGSSFTNVGVSQLVSVPYAKYAESAGGSTWELNGSSIYYSVGNVGVGDATPVATLTVGNGDKFQVAGTDGDVTFSDDEGSIRFPATTAPNSPMIYMFSSGTLNADRMAIAHSPAFSNWGLEYRDTSDVFFFRNSGSRRFSFDLAQGRMGIGREDDGLLFPLEVAGRVRLHSTGSLSNSPGIWFANQTNTFNRAFFGMAEPDSIVGIYSQHMGKWAIEFELMREPRIGINIPAGSPPRAELHLYHTNFGGSNDGVRIQNEGSNGHYWNLYTSNTTGSFEFFKNGIKRATIDPTSGAYTAVSDARLKQNISELGPVLPSVMNLRAKNYQYIDGPDRRYFTGLLAQELEQVFPQFVFHGGDDQVLYTVDYAGMSVIALKAIQEQQATIEMLQAQLDGQEQRMQEQLRMLEGLARRVEELEQK